MVTPYWLESMIECIKHKPKIAIVGPVSNYAGGTQGLNINPPIIPDLEIIEQLSLKIREQNKKLYTREGILVGFCMLINRIFWEEFGFYPEELTTFDDNYISLFALFRGWQLYCDRSTFIYHFGSKAFKDNKMDMRKIMIENERKFREIWKQKEYQNYKNWLGN